MTPAAIIALMRDAVIVGAVLAILWFVHRADVDHVSVTDFKAVQSQLADNAIRAKQYAQEAADAQAQHSHDVETISAAIAAHGAQPVFVRIPTGPGAVHGVSAAPGDQSAAGGRIDAATRGDSQSVVDIRQQVDEFERRFETSLSDCRQVVNSWPKN